MNEFEKYLDRAVNEEISTGSFSTPSGSGGESADGESTPSNFVGTMGRTKLSKPKKKKKKKKKAVTGMQRQQIVKGILSK